MKRHGPLRYCRNREECRFLSIKEIETNAVKIFIKNRDKGRLNIKEIETTTKTVQMLKKLRQGPLDI